MSWSLTFDEPITLAKGKELRTLRDAADHVTALPKKVADLPHWRLAIACLLSAADKRGPVMMAQIAMLQALHAGTPERAVEPRRRRAKAYRILH
jgi:hypothetical protein